MRARKSKSLKIIAIKQLILHMSDVVMQTIKIMKRKFNFIFLDRLFSFLSDIVVSVLQFTASDYPFGIFKLFFKPWWLIPSKQQHGSGLGDAHISGFRGVFVAQTFIFLCVVFFQHFLYCFHFLLFRLAIVLFVYHY